MPVSAIQVPVWPGIRDSSQVAPTSGNSPMPTSGIASWVVWVISKNSAAPWWSPSTSLVRSARTSAPEHRPRSPRPLISTRVTWSSSRQASMASRIATIMSWVKALMARGRFNSMRPTPALVVMITSGSTASLGS
ncbi:Uncharacterised protein [Mycobacteroides abscessus subsp. abscessus]|nr:Uncharacterised protein [Mycobacteroides abscessus subsp. abscessus]